MSREAKAMFVAAKVVLAIIGAFVLLAAASLLLDIPGCNRFSLKIAVEVNGALARQPKLAG